MAKARQVGKPHSLQLVLGSILKIAIPVKAISFSPYPWRALGRRENKYQFDEAVYKKL
jgi:hypothetical protein